MDSTKTEQLKSKLNDEQYKVVVERGTEKAFTGKYRKTSINGNFFENFKFYDVNQHFFTVSFL